MFRTGCIALIVPGIVSGGTLFLASCVQVSPYQYNGMQNDARIIFSGSNSGKEWHEYFVNTEVSSSDICGNFKVAGKTFRGLLSDGNSSVDIAVPTGRPISLKAKRHGRSVVDKCSSRILLFVPEANAHYRVEAEGCALNIAQIQDGKKITVKGIASSSCERND